MDLLLVTIETIDLVNIRGWQYVAPEWISGNEYFVYLCNVNWATHSGFKTQTLKRGDLVIVAPKQDMCMLLQKKQRGGGCHRDSYGSSLLSSDFCSCAIFGNNF